MRKRFLAVAAATVMTMSMAMTAMAAVPTDYTGYYTFEDSLDNGAEGGEAATLTGTKVTEEAKLTAAKFAEGVDGKALSLDATYGLKLGKLITNEQYTVSFDIKIHAATFGTAGVFIESMKGSATPEQWNSIMPVTNADDYATGAPRVWANTADGNRYNFAASVASDDLKAESWVKLTFVKGEKMGTLYVNGVVVGKGWVQDKDQEIDLGQYSLTNDTVNADTLVWLGVNYWDTPLNADIDNLYIYDRALTDAELKDVIGADIKDDVTIEEPKKVEYEKPGLSDTNDSNIFKVEKNNDNKSDDNTMMIVIIAVAVVVVIVVVVAVVAASKKKNTADDADEKDEE